jgi:cytochrome c oxidase subunit IV
MSADSSHGNTAQAVATEHELGAEHEHPTWSVYWKIATILTLITVVEVWCYYLPGFVATPFFVPTLLLLSAAKFVIVVMFYMHLKYDHKLFRVLFTGPLILAMLAITALLFLFGKLAIRTGLLT